MRPSVAPLRRAAHLDGRHAARRRARADRARADGQGGHGLRRPRRRRHHDRHRRRAPAPARRRRPRLHPRRLPPDRRPGRGARQDHRRPPAQRRHRPRRARATPCWPASRPAGCAGTAARTTRRPAPSASRGSARSAAATSCSATTTPPTPSTAASTSTRSQTAPLIEFYEGQGRLVVVDGVGHPDDVFRRLTTAVDEAKVLSPARLGAAAPVVRRALKREVAGSSDGSGRAVPNWPDRRPSGRTTRFESLFGSRARRSRRSLARWQALVLDPRAASIDPRSVRRPAVSFVRAQPPR